jgi:hypothetical protein
MIECSLRTTRTSKLEERNIIMIRKLVCCSLWGWMVLLVPGQAEAQGPYGRPSGFSAQRPAVSPYLNLYRRGNSLAFNYYTLVRPELEMRSSLGQLEQQITTNQQAITDLAGTPPLTPTGHQTEVMNYPRYFLTRQAPLRVTPGLPIATQPGRRGQLAAERLGRYGVRR